MRITSTLYRYAFRFAFPFWLLGIASSSSSSTADEEVGLVSGPLERTIEATVLPETSHLGRHLSWHSAFILVISRVIGSGIFATPGAVVRSAGSIGLSLTIWTAGAVLAACGLGVSLELGCMLPRSGGDKVYLEFIYRRPRFLASTLVAVNAVLLGFTASNCVVFSEYVLFAFGMDRPSDFLRKGLAVGLLTAITVVHGCTPKIGVAVQNVLGWFKVGLVVFMVFAGLFVVIFDPDQTDGSHRRGDLLDWDHLWKDSDYSWGTIATSLFKVFYSYAGLSNMNNVLNDVKDPVRTYKSVSMSALVTALLLYTLVNIAYFIVVPLDEIKSSGELIAALFFERTFGPNLGRKILPLAVALSAGGNVMVVTYALARLNQEIARQGFLPWPELLASTKPFNAPLGGLIVHYIPSLLVIALPPSNQVYSFILEVEGYPAQFFSLAVSGGLLWLRYKRPDLKRPFKVWIGAVVLRIVVSLALVTAPFFPPQHKTGTIFYATYALVGVAIILFGVLYWYAWTVLLPRLRGYKLEEETDVLDDGVAITRLVKVPKEA
ncbi:putative methionine permease [Coniochaeta sp. 2T2.1]|nr:putative methionine permease [Coniochaeta sp. 2T2.1]